MSDQPSAPVLRHAPPGTTMPTSPSGSLCPYPYMGGELHPLKYGGYRNDKAGLFQVMDAEERFIAATARGCDRRTWVDLYETRLDRTAVARLVGHLERIRPHTRKLCLVGCTPRTRRQIRAGTRRLGPAWADSVRFFDDPEEAKKWLIGELA